MERKQGIILAAAAAVAAYFLFFRKSSAPALPGQQAATIPTNDGGWNFADRLSLDSSIFDWRTPTTATASVAAAASASPSLQLSSPFASGSGVIVQAGATENAAMMACIQSGGTWDPKTFECKGVEYFM